MCGVLWGRSFVDKYFLFPNKIKMETNNENSLEMLERLLHDEIRPHSTLGLPSEPQVMRTKRMGHRKAQSISFLQQGKQPVLLSAQGNHKRNSSLSGLSETSDFKVPADSFASDFSATELVTSSAAATAHDSARTTHDSTNKLHNGLSMGRYP